MKGLSSKEQGKGDREDTLPPRGELHVINRNSRYSDIRSSKLL
ncbi:hypothetical protein [Planctomicrobium sp. SH527]